MISDILADIASRPEASWEQLLKDRLPSEPELLRQALIWLRANRDAVVPEQAKPPVDERYELGIILDAGATASVWQAYDLKLARNVAIKVFRVERSPALDEILAEARAACEVISDHVVRVFDVHEGDPPYIVMELVGEFEPRSGVLAPGASAATKRPASIDEAVRWVCDVARGVHDAHLRNVFHRDLKPHNVLITPISRRARIADFGLAVRGSALGTSDRLRRAMGTPGYVAPEQARGLPASLDPHDLDERAALVAIDVWGLGALAYDLVADRPPWQAEGELEPWEIALRGAPPPLPERAPRRLRKILAKALAIDRRARYVTAAELADDLDAYLSSMPTTHDSGRTSRFALWCRRNPQLSLTVVLATVLAVLGVVAYANVVELRGQRNALAAENEHANVEIQQLETRAQDIKRELATADSDLALKVKSLAQVRRTLEEAHKDYDTILGAKERALHDADAATRQLAESLAAARSDRDTAELGRAMYEGFWTRARAEADQAIQDRDQAQKERDVTRKERDSISKERDAALAASAQADKDRDQARSERDRAEAMRARVQAELAEVTAALTRTVLPPDAGAAADARSTPGATAGADARARSP